MFFCASCTLLGAAVSVLQSRVFQCRPFRHGAPCDRHIEAPAGVPAGDCRGTGAVTFGMAPLGQTWGECFMWACSVQPTKRLAAGMLFHVLYGHTLPEHGRSPPCPCRTGRFVRSKTSDDGCVSPACLGLGQGAHCRWLCGGHLRGYAKAGRQAHISVSTFSPRACESHNTPGQKSVRRGAIGPHGLVRFRGLPNFVRPCHKFL